VHLLLRPTYLHCGSSRENLNGLAAGVAWVGQLSASSVIVTYSSIIRDFQVPTPPAPAPWIDAASRLEQYNDGQAVVVLLKFRVEDGAKTRPPRKSGCGTWVPAIRIPAPRGQEEVIPDVCADKLRPGPALG
jgi:hypothetical protein